MFTRQYQKGRDDQLVTLHQQRRILHISQSSLLHPIHSSKMLGTAEGLVDVWVASRLRGGKDVDHAEGL